MQTIFLVVYLRYLKWNFFLYKSNWNNSSIQTTVTFKLGGGWGRQGSYMYFKFFPTISAQTPCDVCSYHHMETVEGAPYQLMVFICVSAPLSVTPVSWWCSQSFCLHWQWTCLNEVSPTSSRKPELWGLWNIRRSRRKLGKVRGKDH